MSTAFGRRGYTGGAIVTQLASDITSGATSISAVLASSYPAANFHIVIDEGVAGFEEKIFCGTRTGNNFTSCLRAEDGTTAVAHVAGASIRHCLTAQDEDEANQVTSVLTTKGDLAIKKAGGATTGWDRLPVGANGKAVMGATGQATGLVYDYPIAVFTTAQRDALAGADLWRGRCIFNTDTGGMDVYYGATTGWRPPWNAAWGLVTPIIARAGNVTGSTTVFVQICATASFTMLANRLLSISYRSGISTSAPAGSIQLALRRNIGGAQVAFRAVYRSVATDANAEPFDFMESPAAGTTSYEVGFNAGATGNTFTDVAATGSGFLSVTDIGPNGSAPAS